jgi:Protein of unknown function (DUF1569)
MSDPRILLTNTFSRLGTSFDFANEKNEKISAWTVGMQAHHSLLAANVILGTLLESVPGEREEGRSLKRTVIMKLGKIPRGRGKSPDAAIPSEDISREELEKLLAAAQEKLKQTENTAPDAWWEHFIFGVMTRDTALKFLNIHTEHHLSLIDDIRSITSNA